MLGAVHTTGVNLQSVAAIGAVVIAIAGGLGRFITRRLERNRKSIEKHFDKVEGHLERQDRAVTGVSERVARLEGPMRRIANGHGDA